MKILEKENKYREANVIYEKLIASPEIKIRDGIKTFSKSWKEQDVAILSASHIVSRSGYSTIMDLELLKTRATLFPTKGQREQEYLYDLHSGN